jgi:protein TonB
LIVGDVASMEVRMVAAEESTADRSTSAPEAPVTPEPPRPEVENAEPPPPVELKPPDLAAIVDPPPPDLRVPEFPVAKIDIPPPPEMPLPVIPIEKPPEPKPKPPQPKPVQKHAPAPPAQAPVGSHPQQAAPAAPSAPKTVSASQLGYVVAPNPVYPGRSRRAGEQGSVLIRVLVDVAGRPAQVSVQTSSGHADLDQSALSAVRASQFRPYSEGGIPQAVWLLVPINFVLR